MRLCIARILSALQLTMLGTFAFAQSSDGAAEQTKIRTLEQEQIGRSICQSQGKVPTALADYNFSETPLIIRGSKIGMINEFRSKTHLLRMEIIEPAGRARRLAFTSHDIHGESVNATLRLVYSPDCEIMQANRIVYQDQTALYAEQLDQSLNPLEPREWLNPPLMKNTGRTDGLAVAMIDSGVNYTLPEIAMALATDEQGGLIGYDFWDNDNTPYDSHPARSPFMIQRHGTRTASILLREAKNIALVPYRYPRPDMSRMKQLIEHAAANSIKVIGMPLGSNSYEEWSTFSDSIENHPEILFIVSAGNNGRDIDINPVYPAALDHKNIIVVTSADDYIRPAERTNYGRISVDYMVSAENIPATDYDGTKVLVSNIEAIKEQIASHSIKANTSKYVTGGFLGDPLADTANIKTHIETLHDVIAPDTKKTITLNLVSLHTDWSNERITKTLGVANTIFSQCDLGINSNNVLHIDSAAYVKHLSPGNALTLQRNLSPHLNAANATIFFADDTDMQEKFDAEAFGLANTRSRPWMQNTVWITRVTKDSGNALAHELYHVLSNSGSHNQITGNLMRDTTALENTVLLPEQCQLALSTAAANSLLDI